MSKLLAQNLVDGRQIARLEVHQDVLSIEDTFNIINLYIKWSCNMLYQIIWYIL